MVPYIGVTGFMEPWEVAAALDAFGPLPHHRRQKLMIGVLVSSRTLDNRPHKWPNRYPDIDGIAGLLPADRRTLNLIHYATEHPSTLAAQLDDLVDIGGEYLDGFQLNIRWPDPATIIVRPHTRIVLQLGTRALKEAGNDPARVAERLDAYKEIITDVLIDQSGGEGIPLDIRVIEAYVRAIQKRHPQIGIGAAGGLSHENCGELRPLARTLPTLSLDAEGRLRTTEDDRLNIREMQEYLVAANAVFEK